MGRPLRAVDGGWVYHVLNRSNARLPIFEKTADYDAFERILIEGVDHYRPRLLAYCLMPNHWHLVVWPEEDGLLSQFVGWITLTHTQRWHAHRQTIGTGHLYQGRFKSFPVQANEHFYSLCRYVERNALRADLCRQAEDWRWSSLWHKAHGNSNSQSLLSKWPVPRPVDWLKHVNRAQSESEHATIRRSVARGTPLGGPRWTQRAVSELGLESTVRPRGRPRKERK